MDFYVYKNNQQVGPFSLMAVRERLQKGEFAYTDLAWRDGLADWTPLRDLMGGALPDATPHAVSTWGATTTPAPRKAPIVARIVTAVVLFFMFFVMVYFVVAILAFVIGGAISGAQAASAANAQGFNSGYAIGLQAGQQFRHDYGHIIVLGSLLFSIVVSPIAAGLMAFSNLFPWCRAK